MDQSHKTNYFELKPIVQRLLNSTAILMLGL